MAMAAFGFFAVSIVALVLTSAVIAMLYALAVL
jgi:hypothetical protein